MAKDTNIISKAVEIVGSLKFKNDMVIDGKVDGELSSENGKVTIGENAYIKGNVQAREVKLFGHVKGTIQSSRCELKTKSKLEGDIKTNMLSMEEGALLAGRTNIGSQS